MSLVITKGECNENVKLLKQFENDTPDMKFKNFPTKTREGNSSKN